MIIYMQISHGPGPVWSRSRVSRTENLLCMKFRMKSICKISLGMGVTFRDESNDNN